MSRLRIEIVVTVCALLITGHALLGCNAAQKENEMQSATAPIEECDRYVEAYASCLKHLSNGDATQIAATRHIQATRTAMREAAKDSARRDELRTTCTNGLRDLRAACP